MDVKLIMKCPNPECIDGRIYDDGINPDPFAYIPNWICGDCGGTGKIPDKRPESAQAGKDDE